jgi:nicotinate-nucleotide adenylyltransferase
VSKKIGIYSGTFDPVHEGHVAFALAAQEQCGLDKVFFLVEPRPRRKQGVKALEHRDAMVSLAIKHHPQLGSIRLGQQRFTAVDTLPVLQERFKGAELCMIMGDDMLAHFANWPHVDQLAASITFVIGIRTHTKPEVIQRIAIIQKTRGFMLRHELFQAPRAEVSSTKVRIGLKRGQDVQGLDPVVRKYIARHGLYTTT